ncbi:MAG: DUF3365 domain-containing protein [Deltaproteobacteria bacterium]|nr:DUF3365 domain-containing protein [Deltaproteobacteria bacterium]
MQDKEKSKASTRLLISISLIIAIAGVCSILAINWRMKTHAREEAREEAMILLDRNLATHTYFSHQLKPVLFKKFEGNTEDNYFEPIWMSSTYAVREIDKYYHSLVKRDYYYKEAAINARSPENEADAFERAFIEKINESPNLNELSDIRIINEIPFFFVLRRGETMEQSCLRCHSTPETAPADLVTYYGPDPSFQRSVGEVVSAISIRIPLGAAYAKVNRLIFHLSLLFGITLLIVFGLTVHLAKRWVFDPLSLIRIKAMEVSKNPEHLGEQIDLPSNLELSELTKAVNVMSSQLRQERDQLELRVLERTEELNNVNLQLAKEVDKHKRTITELEATLKEIKTLRGLLPICSHCKNIRDDKGYWSKIEAYIHKHSDAEFSHGICPECAKKYYPDVDIYDDLTDS